MYGNSMANDSVELPEDTIESIRDIIISTEAEFQNLEDLKNRLGENSPDYIKLEYEELKKKLAQLKITEGTLLNQRKKLNYSRRASRENKTNSDIFNFFSTKSIINSKKMNKLRKAKTESRCEHPSNANTDSINVKLLNSETVVIPVVKGISIGTILIDQYKYPGISREKCVLISSASELIPWNIDSSALKNNSFTVVCKKDSITSPKQEDQHEFNKVFFPRTECSICNKSIIIGLKCKLCDYSFHKKCLRNIVYYESCNKCKRLSVKEPEDNSSILIGVNPNSDNKKPPNSKRHALKDIHELRLAIESAANLIQPYFKNVINSDSILVDQDLSSSINSLNESVLNRAHSDRNNKPVLDEEGNISSIHAKNRLLRAKPVVCRSAVNDWEIDSSEVTIGAEIGSGSYGTVFKANWHGYVAVKRLNIIRQGVEDLEAFKNEVNMLRRTRHANILLFMGCIYQPILGIVTQWCDGSTLYKHIHILETDFDQKKISDFANQIALGMEYLHAKRIIHRDLKSNNIFLQEANIVKIGDFGLATAKNAAASSLVKKGLQPTGSILWMAPEVIRMDIASPYTFKSDVYSYGIVLYEMLSYLLPYYNIGNADQILYMVGRGFLKPDVSIIYQDQNKTLFKMMENCIQFRREQRPFFSQIVKIASKAYNNTPAITRTTSCFNFKTTSALQFANTPVNFNNLNFMCPNSYVAQYGISHINLNM